jgi:hypothetical protein
MFIVTCFLLVSYLAYSWTLKVKTCFSETSVAFQETTLRCIRGDRILHNHSVMKPKSYSVQEKLKKESRVWFPMSFNFSIDLILPVALWAWSRFSLWQKWVPGIILGVKGGRRVRLTTSPPSVSRLSRNCGNLDFSRLHGTRSVVYTLAMRYTLTFHRYL